MATITSAASGNWSAGATWVGGVVPTSADNAIIANTHTVTLDSTSCAALDLTVAVGGTLACSTSVSSTLTTQTFIHMADGAATVNLDVSSNPAVVCQIRINANNSTGQNEGQFRMRTPSVVTFRGAPRKRNTRLTTAISAGATNAFVADASGWRVGDIVVFAQTTAYSAAQVQADEVVLTSVIGNAIAWTGGTTYDHCVDCPVGNFTSNMVFRPNTAQSPATVRYLWGGGTFAQKTFQDVAFVETGSNGDQNTFAFYMWAERGFGGPASLPVTLDSCAFYKFGQGAVGMRELSRPLHVLNSAFYAPTQTRQYASAIHAMGNSYDCGGADSCGFYGIRSSLSVADFGGGAVTSEAAAQPYVRNSTISGCYGPALYFGGKAGEIENVDVFSSHTGLQYRHGTFSAKNLNIGTFNGGIASCFRAEQHEYLGQGVIADSTTQALSLSNLGTYQQLVHSITWLNKNKDVTQQEIYRPFMSIKRENTTKNRSTSSIAIAPTKLATACQRTLSIPCAAGASVRVIGYVQKSHASNVAATVALTGLGSAWGGFTAANNTTWQVWDTGNITNSSGADGNFLLTYTATSASGLTNVVYFDGVPDAPFVTKCRHYGFVFDEANPVRVVNPATAVSVEATALGYTGVTINTGTPQITVGAGTADTFKKVYDYTQAWTCQTANLGSTVLLTSTDGNNFALPTTCRLSWPTMGADGTLVGGRLLLAATGTHTYKLSGTVVEFQTAGTYNMGETQFSGAVEFINTSGGAVTVSIPSGFTPTNTGPNITLSAPVLTTTIAAQVSLAGAEVRIYDLDNSPAGSLGTELAGVESCPGSTFSFSTAAGNSIWVQILLAGYKEYGQQLTAPSASTTFTLVLATETDA